MKHSNSAKKEKEDMETKEATVDKGTHFFKVKPLATKKSVALQAKQCKPTGE